MRSTVIYSGAQSLGIDGRGSTIIPATEDDEGDFDLFVSDGGADLKLTRLGVARGRNGINIIVPADATGDISVSLFQMTVVDNGLFGLLIDDADVNDEDGEGSAAGIVASIASSKISDNGLAKPDVDGVLFIEMGEGSISATIQNSEINGNGGDGLELCESDDGDTVLDARHSTFDGNGIQEDDTQDAIDIDENDDGNVLVRMVDVTVINAEDEGLDFDEDNNGSFFAILVRVEVSGTGDDGIKLDEDNDGDFYAELVDVTSDGTGEDGLDMKEDDDGNMFVRVANSSMSDNAEFGIAAEQDDDGEGSLRLLEVSFANNNGNGTGR